MNKQNKYSLKYMKECSVRIKFITNCINSTWILLFLRFLKNLFLIRAIREHRDMCWFWDGYAYTHTHLNAQFGRWDITKFINIVHPLTPLSSPFAKTDAGESEGPLESYPGYCGCLIREPYERVVSWYVPWSRFPPPLPRYDACLRARILVYVHTRASCARARER